MGRAFDMIYTAIRQLAVRALGLERVAAFHVWRRQFSAQAERIVDHPRFEKLVVGMILLNAAILGLGAAPSVIRAAGSTLHTIDQLILAFFTVEISLRIIAKGRAFFRSGWSWFDMIAVGVSYLPDSGGLAALRTLRVFRVLRLFSVVPAMRRVIASFFAAMPSMAGVLGALAVIFYVSAVITTTVFGQADFTQMDFSGLEEPPTTEDFALLRDLFGTLDRSFFTLFQLMTLENWVDGIVGPTMKIFPNAIFFFGPFIVLTAFAILNLFIGVIVESMQGIRDEEHAAEEEARDEAMEAREMARDAERSADIETLLQEVRALRAEIAQQRGASGESP